MDPTTGILLFIGLGSLLAILVFTLRCWLQNKPSPSRHRMDDHTVLITGADSSLGIELVRELCRRGARVIMGVEDTFRAQDVAVEARGETNADVIVEYVDMASLKSIMDFCSKILETESRLHVLINLKCLMWSPMERTSEGFEAHFGINHLAHFVITRLLMPLLHRGAPDARIVTVTSSWLSRGTIDWNDPNFSKGRCYSATEAFNQSKLANLLFTIELARKLENTGVTAYCVDAGPSSSGLGVHFIRGLGLLRCWLALCCWLPWLQTSENAIQSILYCATETELREQTGLFYRNCTPQPLPNNAASLEDAHRLWETSERLAKLTS